jgi:hypothetical protein
MISEWRNVVETTGDRFRGTLDCDIDAREVLWWGFPLRQVGLGLEARTLSNK